MAKRSDRRVRRQPAAGGATAPAAKAAEPVPAAYRTRQFWLGVLAAACLLVPVAVAAAVIAGGGDEQPSAAAVVATPESEEQAAQREVERLQRATQTRDKEQVKELTDRTRGFADDLAPIVDGIARTLPPGDDGKVGPLASPAEVRDWVRRSRAARRFFADSVSGETGTNVARGAFATAVNSLFEMVETYQLALDDPSARAELFDRVRGQRDVTMRAWETGTVQLDAINIATGYGHQHVAPLGAGGLPPDDLPEGTGAVDDNGG